MWGKRRIVAIAFQQAVVPETWGKPKNRMVGWVVEFPKSAVHLEFSGGAATIFEQVLAGEWSAMGILLDRLEEYPHEGGKPKSLVLAAVKWYRMYRTNNR